MSVAARYRPVQRRTSQLGSILIRNLLKDLRCPVIDPTTGQTIQFLPEVKTGDISGPGYIAFGYTYILFRKGQPSVGVFDNESGEMVGRGFHGGRAPISRYMIWYQKV